MGKRQIVLFQTFIIKEKRETAKALSYNTVFATQVFNKETVAIHYFLGNFPLNWIQLLISLLTTLQSLRNVSVCIKIADHRLTEGIRQPQKSFQITTNY